MLVELDGFETDEFAVGGAGIGSVLGPGAAAAVPSVEPTGVVPEPLGEFASVWVEASLVFVSVLPLVAAVSLLPLVAAASLLAVVAAVSLLTFVVPGPGVVS